MATPYVTDKDGKFIPATQRPDGTWRKPRRVKDGYVPQEEVPLYESKGKKFVAARPPGVPVGMSAEYVQAAKNERQKKQKPAASAPPPPKKNPIPGVLNITTKFEPVKKPKFNSVQNTTASEPASNQVQQTPSSNHTVDADVDQLAHQLNGAAIDVKQEISKKLKKLRKKMRDIEEIEAKLKSGELKVLDKDKQDKVSRKQEILNEIMQLEESRKDLKK